MAEATELRREATAEPLFGSWLDFAMGSVGSKMVMALTGAFLWVFLCGHLAGNLLLYVGRDTFNNYAATLHHTPLLLWSVRVGMIVCLPVHFLTSIRTTMMNRAARPQDYAYANNAPARAAATTMILSGLVVVAFVCYHLAHFTLRVTGPQPGAVTAAGENDAFSMVLAGFTNPLIAGFYVLGVGLLAMHLSHGLYSMFQHLGLWGKKWTPWLKNASLVVGYGMCAAFASLPLAVFMGVVK